MTPRGAKPDTVDTNLEIWGRELPELDLETEGIICLLYTSDAADE